MQTAATNKQITSPTTAAAALRLFLHDCSILVSFTLANKAERDTNINLSSPGDKFDIVVQATTVLELACPSVVSCVDILAVVVRDLVTMMGGPY
ncbi:hypothetical protein Vadar_026850 [Vaccinium darrowii]|uniref:Uncharacterized protein n=1 Tax=Vaccinium darrowii TaxID=229202 RepID=A0ACB7X4W1_9ERIC|nr:hypothetical protein Vadar_026850 [Vaccinium darrowii]